MSLSASNGVYKDCGEIVCTCVYVGARLFWCSLILSPYPALCVAGFV